MFLSDVSTARSTQNPYGRAQTSERAASSARLNSATSSYSLQSVKMYPRLKDDGNVNYWLYVSVYTSGRRALLPAGYFARYLHRKTILLKRSLSLIFLFSFFFSFFFLPFRFFLYSSIVGSLSSVVIEERPFGYKLSAGIGFSRNVVFVRKIAGSRVNRESVCMQVFAVLMLNYRPI